MNAGTITAVITGATAVIGAVTSLVIVIMHIIRHQPMPGDNTGKAAAKPGMIPPATDQKWPQ